MRPTLLNFRSPKEKTPEYYNVSITHQGEKLHFRSKSINKKASNLPQAERFRQYNLFPGGSGVSCFLGPGSYNDHDDFIKLVQNPCPIKMVTYFIDYHNRKKYQPCQTLKAESLAILWWEITQRLSPAIYPLENKQMISNMQMLINVPSTQNVSITMILIHIATIKQRSISQIKERISYQYVENNRSSLTGGFSSNNDSALMLNSSFKNAQLTSKLHSSTRPQTCSQCKRNMTGPLSSQPLNMSISTKASTSGKLAQGDQASTTIGAISQASNLDKSPATMDLTSQQNLVRINEEDPSKEILTDTNNYLSEQNQVRIKSMLPKTANNFHKLKKGLYLNPLKGHPYNLKEEALARSFNILSAYGEILPMLGQHQKKKRSSGGSQRKSKTRRNILHETHEITPEPKYMNVIRDSPAIIQQRENLERQKREILNMKFDEHWRKMNKDHQDINKYMTERYNGSNNSSIINRSSSINQTYDNQQKNLQHEIEEDILETEQQQQNQ